MQVDKIRLLQCHIKDSLSKMEENKSKVEKGQESEENVKKDSDSDSNKTSKYQKRPPVFEYPALSKWESGYYFIFTICILIWAWSRVYVASRDYEWDGGYGSYDENELPFFGQRKKDVTNWEWRSWTPYLWKVIPWLIGHSLLFNISEKYVSQKAWSTMMLVYWLIACLILYEWLLLSMTIASGLLVYCTMRLTKSKICVWLVSIAILHFGLNSYHWLPEPINYYVSMAFISYKMLQYISFTLEECDNGRPENQNFWRGMYNMFWYAFYFPYLNSLIVIYRTFPPQVEMRKTQHRQWSKIIWFGVRITFWYFFIEFFLHFFYFDALMADYDFLETTSEDTMLSMGYAIGSFFQMKYVVIFGMPAFFAKVDNMQPLDGPVCINRISLYSKIWRNFDRGLYNFFKEYIFLPICRPTFSLPRVIIGVFVSYGFVLVWHGFTHQYIVWIILNIVELFIENIAKRVYVIPCVLAFRKKVLSDVGFRRVLAFLHDLPFALGLYAIFYFLSDSEAGYIIVDRIFWQETVTFHYPFFLLLFLGYHYANFCMDVERWQNAKAKKAAEKVVKEKAKEKKTE